jgi:hypothetical protein
LTAGCQAQIPPDRWRLIEVKAFPFFSAGIAVDFSSKAVWLDRRLDVFDMMGFWSFEEF